MSADSADPALTVRRFYAAFARKDSAQMAACYAPEVRFHDPAFGDLHGSEARAMWRMLCERSKDLTVTLDHAEASAGEGRAQWTARYTFTQTGRSVVNVVQARFTFTAAGLIATHHDAFPFWRWARQALGPAGLLLGWSPMLRGKVRAEAGKSLQAYMGKLRKT